MISILSYNSYKNLKNKTKTSRSPSFYVKVASFVQLHKYKVNILIKQSFQYKINQIFILTNVFLGAQKLFYIIK